MKTYKTIFFFGLLSLAVLSCNNKLENVTEQPSPKDETPSTVCTITASMEDNAEAVANNAAPSSQDQDSKTIIRSGNKVYWVSGDNLQVYAKDGGNNINRYQFTTDITSASATANFSKEGWDGSLTPIYATSCSNGSSNSDYCTLEGVIETFINPLQSISNIGSFGTRSSASVGKIESVNGTSFSIPEMKNVPAVLKINIRSNTIKSIEISAPGGEDVAGKIRVDYSKLVGGDSDFFTVVSGSKTITMTPSGSVKNNDNCFIGKPTDDANSRAYCFCLLPQTYTQGLKLILTNKDDETAIRTVGASSGLTLARNIIRDFSTDIDKGLFRKPDIVLGFTSTSSNPFSGLATSKDDASTSNADFTQTVDGVTYTFTSVGSTGAYWSSAFWNNLAGHIKLPRISGYKLHSILVQGANSTGKPICITTDTNGTTPGGGNTIYIASSNKGNADGSDASNAIQEYTFTLTDTYSANTDYYYRPQAKQIKLTKFQLTYVDINAL